MRTLDEPGVSLLWKGRGWFSRTYDLVPADGQDPASEPFATLRWREAFVLGRSRGELTAANGTWRFEPDGLLGRRVRVVAGDGTLVGTFGRAWRSRTLQLEAGPTFQWRRIHWLRGRWAFLDPNGFEVARFAHRFSWFNPRATVEIESAVPPELRALLAGFGFFLVRRSHAAARRAAT